MTTDHVHEGDVEEDACCHSEYPVARRDVLTHLEARVEAHKGRKCWEEVEEQCLLVAQSRWDEQHEVSCDMQDLALVSNCWQHARPIQESHLEHLYFLLKRLTSRRIRRSCAVSFNHGLATYGLATYGFRQKRSRHLTCSFEFQSFCVTWFCIASILR